MRKKYGIIKKAESKGDCLDFMAEQILHMQDPSYNEQSTENPNRQNFHDRFPFIFNALS